MQDILSQIILLVQQIDAPTIDPPGPGSNVRTFLGWGKWISLFLVPFALIACSAQIFSEKKTSSKMKYVAPVVLVTCSFFALLAFYSDSLVYSSDELI